MLKFMSIAIIIIWFITLLAIVLAFSLGHYVGGVACILMLFLMSKLRVARGAK